MKLFILTIKFIICMKKYTGIRNHLFRLHKKKFISTTTKSVADAWRCPQSHFEFLSLFFFFFLSFFFTNNCKFVYKTNKSVTFQNVLSHPHNISLYILNHDKSARQSLRNKASVFDGKYCRLVISNSSLLFLICSCSFNIPYIETCNRSPTPSSLS